MCVRYILCCAGNENLRQLQCAALRKGKITDMPKYIEKIDTLRLPAVVLDGIVIFPLIPTSFELSSADSIAACERASRDGGKAFFVLKKPSDAEAVSSHEGAERAIEADDIYEVGCVALIKQIVKFRENSARIVVEGMSRATVISFESEENGSYTADVLSKAVIVEGSDPGIEAVVLALRNMFADFSQKLPKLSGDLLMSIGSITSPGLLSDFISCNTLLDTSDKQAVLEQFDPVERARVLSVILAKETVIARTELEIRQKVQAGIDRGQREYYLREQLRVIQAELGEGHAAGDTDGDFYDEDDTEIAEYMAKIAGAKLSDEVETKLVKETKKLAKTPYNSAEAGVIRNYLDICLELPWGKRSKDRIDVEAAKRILDRDHDGLEKVKERILEYLAVKQLNPELRHQIICLVGPPGTGKTSIAKSIADSMKRKYVRVSLGGIRDEADIRGHRKTYIGSMPGRIINAINQAGVSNPLMLLDEIDKLTKDAHGDPSSAMLEVLDGEQNKTFRDHFIELPFDLSECMFIATANSTETIPEPLLDRMEIIELHTYTRHEKAAIAKHHLIPKQRKRHGLTAKELKFNDSGIYEIIDYYTSEAGVRGLERKIASICRKTAKQIVEAKKAVQKAEEKPKAITVTAEIAAAMLGSRRIIPDSIEKNYCIGEVNGLAYTEVGGDLLRIEAVSMPGTGKLKLTGSLGDVMKESAQAAVTYIRAHSAELSVDPDFYKTKDIHIHVPEGAVPKDGPSAGVTIATALASELSGRSVRRDVAMTGEITLHGRVLPIGGLREKTMAAYKTGVKTVLIPGDNVRDLEEIDPIVKKALRFVPCSQIGDVLREALI